MSNKIQCQCGEWSGTACEWSGPKSATVIVEFMPEHLRASHGAGTRGAFPSNGAQRIRVEKTCAGLMVKDDGEWCAVVATATKKTSFGYLMNYTTGED